MRRLPCLVIPAVVSNLLVGVPLRLDVLGASSSGEQLRRHPTEQIQLGPAAMGTICNGLNVRASI